MALLPNISQPVTPGKMSLPYDTMNLSSVHNQIMRAMRQSRGFDQYLLTIGGSEAKTDFLAAFSGLSKDDASDEAKLSAALDDLLCVAIETIDDATNGYSDADKPILKALTMRSLKLLIADAVTVFVEDCALELAQIRAETTHAA